MERAFVDTSAWFAYANRHDPDHTRIRNVLRTFQGRLNRATGDSYTHAAILAWASEAICSTAAVMPGS